LLDARTGSVTTLFEGAFRSYAHDSASNTILLQSEPFFDSDPERGLYLIQASEPYQVTRISAPAFSTLIPIGSIDYPFSGFLEDNGLALIGLDGSIRTIDELSWYPYPAPTQNLLALQYFPRAYGLWIYDIDNDQRIDVLSEGSIFRMTWSPDSSALFYVADGELHSFLPDSRENTLIYTWPANSLSDIDLKWVILP
ncbi:MAG: hypothetical protein PVG63_05235, partial [Anaerolineales bacterium]